MTDFLENLTWRRASKAWGAGVSAGGAAAAYVTAQGHADWLSIGAAVLAGVAVFAVTWLTKANED